MNKSILKLALEESKKNFLNIKVEKIFYINGVVDDDQNIVNINDESIYYHSFFVSFNSVQFFIPFSLLNIETEIERVTQSYLSVFNNFFNKIIRFNQYNPNIIKALGLESYDLYIGKNDKSIQLSEYKHFASDVKATLLNQYNDFINDKEKYKNKFVKIEMSKGWENGYFIYSDHDSLKNIYFQRIDNDVIPFRPMVHNYLNQKGSFLSWQQGIERIALNFPFVYFCVAMGLVSLYKDLLPTGIHCWVTVPYTKLSDNLKILPYIINSVSGSPKDMEQYYDNAVFPFMRAYNENLDHEARKQLKLEILNNYKYKCLSGVCRSDKKDVFNYLESLISLNNEDKEKPVTFFCNTERTKFTKTSYDKNNTKTRKKFNKYDDINTPILFEIILADCEIPIKNFDRDRFSLTENYGHLFKEMSKINLNVIKEEYIKTKKEFHILAKNHDLITPSQTDKREYAILNFFVLLASIMNVAYRKKLFLINFDQWQESQNITDLFFCFYLRFAVDYKTTSTNLELIENTIIDSKLIQLFSRPVTYVYGMLVSLLNRCFHLHPEQLEDNSIKMLYIPSTEPLKEFYNNINSTDGLIIYRKELYFTTDALARLFKDYDIYHGFDALENRLSYLGCTYCGLQLFYKKDIELYVCQDYLESENSMKPEKEHHYLSNASIFELEVYKLDANIEMLCDMVLKNYSECASIDYKFKYLHKYGNHYFEPWNPLYLEYTAGHNEKSKSYD